MATGDKNYADLVCDIQHADIEAMDISGHRTTNNGFGTEMERIQLFDADGKETIATVNTNSREKYFRFAPHMMSKIF